MTKTIPSAGKVISTVLELTGNNLHWLPWKSNTIQVLCKHIVTFKWRNGEKINSD